MDWRRSPGIEAAAATVCSPDSKRTPLHHTWEFTAQENGAGKQRAVFLETITTNGITLLRNGGAHFKEKYSDS